jgi:hypothetical protein
MKVPSSYMKEANSKTTKATQEALTFQDLNRELKTF